MWGTFEKRLALGAVTLVWLCWMTSQCVWQMWGHRALPADTSSPNAILPIHRARHILEPFATNIPASFSVAKDMQNPFYPNPSQPPPPAPPIITRQVPLLYQGFYATSAGEKRAYVQVNNQTLVGPTGTKIIAGYFISEITSANLTLADASGKKLVLEFRTSKSIEIPL
jgi:hypothetical protein